MAEAFGAVANIAGVVSLGLTVCQGLLTYYGSWNGAPADVDRMYKSIKALNDTFGVLKILTKDEKFGSDIGNNVKQSIES